MLEAQIISVLLGIVSVLVTLVSYYFYIRGRITGAVSGAINDAEQADKTGEEKLELAVEQVYFLVPVLFKAIITKTFVRQLVQETFNKIEEYAVKQAMK